MTTATKPRDALADMAARFDSDTAHHQMTVLHNDGLYRHLRFKRPGTGMYWFDLVTWPGSLTITGDYGPSYTFRRLDDMFEFFRGNRINPSYWAEKLASHDRRGVSAYSEDQFRQHVTDWIKDQEDEYPGLAEAVQERVLDPNDCDTEYEDSARELLSDFVHQPADANGNPDGPAFRFVDTWEWDLTDWRWEFLWACHAIVWGIAQYDKVTAQVTA